MSEIIENPALNIFSADVVSEILASENAIDFAFETKDFPVTFKRLDFPADMEFSKTMRIRFKCTGSAHKNRLFGKEFSIPFYSTKYVVDADGDNIVDLFRNKQVEETGMRFADEIVITGHDIALPESGPKPAKGKMYAYQRLQGYPAYLAGKEKKESFFALRDAILATDVVVGQEKNYLRKLTTVEPMVRFFNPSTM